MTYVLFLYVYHNNKEFLDGETLHYSELYEGMREGKIYKTGQVPPETFKKSLPNMQKNNPVYMLPFLQLYLAHAKLL